MKVLVAMLGLLALNPVVAKGFGRIFPQGYSRTSKRHGFPGSFGT
jgi:hypothetical protein